MESAGSIGEGVLLRHEAFVRDVNDVLTKVKKVANDCAPDKLTFSWEQGYVFGFFMRMSSVFDAVGDLLTNDHGEEARAVTRSLLEESILVQYLAARAADTKEIVLRWLLHSLREEESLWTEAMAQSVAGADKPLDDVRQALAELREYLKKENLAEKNPPGLRDMANAIERPYLYYLFKLASGVVHSSRQGFFRILRRVSDSNFSVNPWYPDPGNVVFIAGVATEEYLRGFNAANQLLGWECREAIKQVTIEATAAFSALRTEAAEIEALLLQPESPEGE